MTSPPPATANPRSMLTCWSNWSPKPLTKPLPKPVPWPHELAQWLSFGEYMQRCFLGKSVCSLSMASGTGLLNIRARAWDTQLLPVLNIRPDQLPPLGDIHDRVQGLKPEYASRWPALRDIPWYPAIGDGAAA